MCHEREIQKGCVSEKVIRLYNSSMVCVSRQGFLLGVAVSLSQANGFLVLLIVLTWLRFQQVRGSV